MDPDSRLLGAHSENLLSPLRQRSSYNHLHWETYQQYT